MIANLIYDQYGISGVGSTPIEQYAYERLASGAPGTGGTCPCKATSMYRNTASPRWSPLGRSAEQSPTTLRKKKTACRPQGSDNIEYYTLIKINGLHFNLSRVQHYTRIYFVNHVYAPDWHLLSYCAAQCGPLPLIVAHGIYVFMYLYDINT